MPLRLLAQLAASVLAGVAIGWLLNATLESREDNLLDPLVRQALLAHNSFVASEALETLSERGAPLLQEIRGPFDAGPASSAVRRQPPAGAFPLGGRAETRTDAEGMLALSVDRQLFGPKGCDLSLEIDAGSGRVERSAVVLVAAVSDADETPVGDIRMAAPDLLVTGVVVDDDGVPLSNALVTIEDWQINPQKGAGRGTNVAAALARFRTWTDGAGAFEMPLPPRVRAKINGFSVAAEHPRHLCRDRVRGVQKGAKDVKVVLHGAGRVEGSLLLPELAPVRRLEMIILRSDVVGTMGVKKQRFDDCVDSDGRFRSTDLMPGTVTVSIRMPPFPEPLVEIPTSRSRASASRTIRASRRSISAHTRRCADDVSPRSRMTG